MIPNIKHNENSIIKQKDKIIYNDKYLELEKLEITNNKIIKSIFNHNKLINYKNYKYHNKHINNQMVI